MKTICEKCIYCANPTQARITDEKDAQRELTEYFSFSCAKCGAQSFYLRGIKNTPLRFVFPRYHKNKKFEKPRKRTIEAILNVPLM